MDNFSTSKKITKTASLARCFLFGFGFLLLLVMVACKSSSQPLMFVLSGPIMGTDYRVTVVTDGYVDEQALHQSLLKVMNRVNESMSHYDPSSELSKINDSQANLPIQLSEALQKVIEKALNISVISDGAFDITLAPVIDLWGFGKDGQITQKPSLIEMKKLTESVGYSHLNLKNGLLTKSHSQTQLNLSAIAKGFAVDQVANELERHDIQNYLVNIGGELRAKGVNVDSQSWRVGIEKPELLGGIQQVVELNNNAIATSGDYLNYLVLDGRRFSHTIDPVTLTPVFHRLASVSVIHDNAMIADALATAIMVKGEEQGFKFAEKLQLAAYFVIRDEDGDGLNYRLTNEMASYINQ